MIMLLPFRHLRAMRIIITACTVLLAGCGTQDAGERIYVEGIGSDGAPVEAIVDRSGLIDPARVLACASCHGEDRRGLRSPIPEFGPYVAPDITPERLAVEIPGRRLPYNAATLRRVLVDGITSSGRRLHHPMPRWRMSDTDMQALVAYLLGGA